MQYLKIVVSLILKPDKDTKKLGVNYIDAVSQNSTRNTLMNQKNINTIAK